MIHETAEDDEVQPMPKQNLVRDPTKERAELFSGLIDKYLRIRHKTNKDIAKAIGLSDSVMYARRQNPRSFSFPEILLLMDYLGFTPADRAEVAGVEIKIYGIS